MSNYESEMMKKSMILAEFAYSIGEVPVGAVITKDNKIIGEGFNSVISNNSPIFHAEINAINMACRNIKNYRLNDCEMFITLEPCHMCAKAIVDARIKKVYFSTREPKTGSIVSIDNFFAKSSLNHSVEFHEGLLKDESSLLLKNFFRIRRNKDSKN